MYVFLFFFSTFCISAIFEEHIIMTDMTFWNILRLIFYWVGQVCKTWNCLRKWKYFKGTQKIYPQPLQALSTFIQGRIQGGGRLGARPLFRILRERALSLTTAMEKETKRKTVGKRRNIEKRYFFSPPPSSLPAISVYPLSPFVHKN